MLSPHIYAALVHERQQTFLAQAETDRRKCLLALVNEGRINMGA